MTWESTQNGPYGDVQHGGYYGPPPVQPTNTYAIMAIVFAFVFAPLGLVFGLVAQNQIKRTGEAGQGMALAGIIVSAISILIAVVTIIIVVAGAVSLSAAVTSTP